ncbi:MAG: DUF58 domain-containing protein [Rhodoferax sp.]|nr:DUF58 domain-containing protein [Rhodoferax sp.]
MNRPQSASGIAHAIGGTQWFGTTSRKVARAWNPFALVRTRFHQWFQSRLPLTDRLTLTQRNVYILPTGAGWMLGITLLVLLVASINYQLNLGYLLTFLLAGCAVVAMHVSHANLRGLTMHLVAPNAVYARANALFFINLQNEKKSSRYAIAVALDGTQHWAWTNVLPQASAQVQLGFKPAQRGLHRLPTVTLKTVFPLGTFQVWALWRPHAQVMVYPAPEPHPPPLPTGGSEDGSHASTSPTLQGEPDGVRPYRRGDSLKHIVWKKAAKTGELVSRDHVAWQSHTLWLTPQLTQLANPEAQLSRLCAWVQMAEATGQRYGLRLPGQELTPGNGPSHQQRCLQALALA